MNSSPLPSSGPSAPSKSPDVISGMFNRISGTYDLLNDCMTGGMHRLWKRQACRMLQLPVGGSALDVCTGTGDLAKVLSEMAGPQGDVQAIDFSEGMLAMARERYPNLGNVHWVQGDALDLPFEDNQFDGSIISFGLRNVASVEQALSEMIRVTKPGGWVINLDTASDCRNPLFWLYFSTIMPVMGKLLARDKQAYSYLCRSTQTFQSPRELSSLMTGLGLNRVTVRYMGLRSVSVQAGQKA